MLIELGRWIPDILEEHVEELGWLWPAREAALGSPEQDGTGLARLERRIEAHTDALVLADEVALPLLLSGLGEDAGSTLASTTVLLGIGAEEGHEAVLEALARSEGDVRDAVRTGLCRGPLSGLAEPLRERATSGGPGWVAATEVLAFHGLPVEDDRLRGLLGSPDPDLQAGGWRTAALLGREVEPRLLAAGVRSDQGAVRRAALEAAAWLGYAGVLPVCRALVAGAEEPPLEALRVLAVLGGPEDLDTFRSLAGDAGAGAGRFALVATFGHPELLGVLVDLLDASDPEVAAAAGAAFERMTGRSVLSAERVPVGPAADDVEAAFRDEVAVPDPDLAREVLEENAGRWSARTRIAGGRDASIGPGAPGFEELDLLSRREAALRARHSGRWDGGPADLVRFPRTRT